MGAAALRAAALRGLPARAQRADLRKIADMAEDKSCAARVRPASSYARPIGAVTRRRSVVVEADGGSRGNPGPGVVRGGGARRRDRRVSPNAASTLGIATNNVAEYSGLIAGLDGRRHATRREVEVRMDSKLVIEQMAGRWKIKHANIKPLAAKAQRIPAGRAALDLDPAGAELPRRRLANAALDDEAAGGSG